MKLSDTMGATAVAAMLAASGIASAATTTYATNGYVTAASDGAGGAICGAFGLAVGSPSTSTIIYPGAGMGGMQILSPGTKASANVAGSASTNVCTTTDSASINGSSPMTFSCYVNKTPQKTPPATVVASIVSTFNSVATHSAAALNVETNSTITVGASSCTYTTDATWIAE